jgi:hypothetical protein
VAPFFGGFYGELCPYIYLSVSAEAHCDPVVGGMITDNESLGWRWVRGSVLSNELTLNR